MLTGVGISGERPKANTSAVYPKSNSPDRAGSDAQAVHIHDQRPPRAGNTDHKVIGQLKQDVAVLGPRGELFEVVNHCRTKAKSIRQPEQPHKPPEATPHRAATRSPAYPRPVILHHRRARSSENASGQMRTDQAADQASGLAPQRPMASYRHCDGFAGAARRLSSVAPMIVSTRPMSVLIDSGAFSLNLG